MTATIPSVEDLAKKFSAVLMEWLELSKMQQVVALNTSKDDKNICHSHDYCDANMAMLDAWESFGMSEDSFFEGDNMAFADTAWTLAKKNNFWVAP